MNHSPLAVVRSRRRTAAAKSDNSVNHRGAE
jgi:hypothetical protein